MCVCVPDARADDDMFFLSRSSAVLAEFCEVSCSIQRPASSAIFSWYYCLHRVWSPSAGLHQLMWAKERETVGEREGQREGGAAFGAASAVTLPAKLTWLDTFIKTMPRHFEISRCTLTAVSRICGLSRWKFCTLWHDRLTANLTTQPICLCWTAPQCPTPTGSLGSHQKKGSIIRQTHDLSPGYADRSCSYCGAAVLWRLIIDVLVPLPQGAQQLAYKWIKCQRKHFIVLSLSKLSAFAFTGTRNNIWIDTYTYVQSMIRRFTLYVDICYLLAANTMWPLFGKSVLHSSSGVYSSSIVWQHTSRCARCEWRLSELRVELLNIVTNINYRINFLWQSWLTDIRCYCEFPSCRMDRPTSYYAWIYKRGGKMKKPRMTCAHSAQYPFS